MAQPESAEQALLQRAWEGYAGDSLTAVGAAVAPAIGAAVCTLAAPGAGKYEITAQGEFGATVAAGDADNLELRHGATVVGKIPVAAIANSKGQPIRFPRVTVAAAEAITINATAGATAGANYRANLTATPLAD